MRFVSMFSVVVLAVTVYGQSIVTPVFVHKDGEASMSGYAGSHRELVVDGGGQQVVGWITFQTAGVDFSKVTSAKLTLYVKDLQSPGTLAVYPLTSAITAPENYVSLASLSMGAAAAATVGLGTENFFRNAIRFVKTNPDEFFRIQEAG